MKRLLISIILGAILGVICILGANLRFNNTLDLSYLYAFWYNRLLMGIVIGLITYKITLVKTLLRGAVIGLIVSFAFYSATGFLDFTGFIVGVVYGVIIEFVAFKIA